MRYRYAFANSGWADMNENVMESTGVLKGVKPTWQDGVAQPGSVRRSTSLPFVRSFSKHPVLTVLLNGVVFLAILAIIAHVFFDFKTLHPFVLLFIALASGSLSSVLSVAVEEFYGEKERN